tara:strand:- start:44 stop:745 length:702 start_codon:yes stop_codon:yes gene_type:complete
MGNSADHYKELLQVSYESDKTIQSIIHFSGISIFFEQFVSQRVKEIRLERTKTFFSNLELGKINLSDEIIKSEDFLHKFVISYKAVLNTRRREKIIMFSNLFRTSLFEKGIEDVDTFEDYLKILDELSYREIQALNLLESFYSTPKDLEETDLKWTSKFWNDFVLTLSETINISPNKVDDFIKRITRSGCYELFTGVYVNDTGSKGKLTPTFFDLKDFALSKKETVTNPNKQT